MIDSGARFVARLLEFGTGGYPHHIARRLKILNACGYLIALFTAGFALFFAIVDFKNFHWVVAIDAALIAVALCVPFLHRVNDLLGGVAIAIGAPLAVFGEAALVGRQSGTQVTLVIGAAAGFFIFGLDRLRLCIVVVVGCFALFVASWYLFPAGIAGVSPAPILLGLLHISSTVTAFAIIALLVYYAFKLARKAEAQTESILRNILPDEIVDRLRRDPDGSVSQAFAEASVLFSDIQGFVPLSKRLGPERTVTLLNELIRGFDSLAAKYGVEKIKTIGDAYMAVAGLPNPALDHAARLARMALDMLDVANEVAERFGIEIRIRIGIASGPVTAGIIGTKKFSYDVWGDPVNLAARLESTGEPERIQISREAWKAMVPYFNVEPRGEIEIKGLGRQPTWFLVGPRADAPLEPTTP